MPFLIAFIKNVNTAGDAGIDDVLRVYTSFYEDRLTRGLPVDRKICPYNGKTLKDSRFIKQNMLTNPFEKFERKRSVYYSRDPGSISMNHALFDTLDEDDFENVRIQMREDLENYYRNIS